MLKPIFIALLSFVLPFSNISLNLFNGETQINDTKAKTITLEKMIVANGTISMSLDLNRLNGNQLRSRSSKNKRSLNKDSGKSVLKFDIEPDSFFTVLVYDDELRGPTPSSMNIIPKSSAAVPNKLSSSFDNLLLEHMPFGDHHELVVRDRKTGFIFFNVEGHLMEFDSSDDSLEINSGRVLISKEFAEEMGRPNEAGTVIGDIEINSKLRPIEVQEIVDGAVKSNVLPAGTGRTANAGTRPGPDVVVGDVFGLAQFGNSSGTKVGLALGTTSCNFGEVDLNWNRLPSNDHPVIPQNLYRMNADGSRFEQVGQSQVKHGFFALTQNLCGLGCNGVGNQRLGSGCSDPYSAGLNAGPNLGSKAWINPFTGVYPRGDSATSPNNHGGHSHQGPDHRILTEINDLSTQMNLGSRYFAEGQYVTPHEFRWCEDNPGECNMNNNTSYREYNVNGVGSPFSFSPVGSTVREKSAINAWEGAVLTDIQPDPLNDGVITVAFKVTETSPGVWHYEYAIYNQNLDRGIQSFSVPVGGGVSLTDVGFHAPPQHEGALNDGTLNNLGYSETPWAAVQSPSDMTWSTETFAQNQNANAIRWGTMYNFRFDSTSPPQNTNATIGFYKTGSPMTVGVQGPSGVAVAVASMSGRVTAGNIGVGYARVSVQNTSSLGANPISAFTNQFGYYRIEGLTAGQTYDVTVESKSYTFTSQQVQLDDNVSGINFEAED